MYAGYIMNYADLVDFISNKMSMSHIYQPLLIKSLVDADGTATLRQLSHNFLAQDESQLQKDCFYKSILSPR